MSEYEYDIAEQIDDDTARGYMLQDAAEKARCTIEELCFSCEKAKIKYVDHLCQHCHELALCETLSQCYEDRDFTKPGTHIAGCPALAALLEENKKLLARCGQESEYR